MINVYFLAKGFGGKMTTKNINWQLVIIMFFIFLWNINLMNSANMYVLGVFLNKNGQLYDISCDIEIKKYVQMQANY